jgi:hypothetical protein
MPLAFLQSQLSPSYQYQFTAGFLTVPINRMALVDFSAMTNRNGLFTKNGIFAGPAIFRRVNDKKSCVKIFFF